MYPTMPSETKNNEEQLLTIARMNPPVLAPRMRRFAPVALAEKKNGTKNAGSEYFQACIMALKGLPPVMAAAAEGDKPTGGETSDRTAK